MIFFLIYINSISINFDHELPYMDDCVLLFEAILIKEDKSRLQELLHTIKNRERVRNLRVVYFSLLAQDWFINISIWLLDCALPVSHKAIEIGITFQNSTRLCLEWCLDSHRKDFSKKFSHKSAIFGCFLSFYFMSREW